MAKVVELSGADGSGKTTGLKYLSEKLTSLGYRVLTTREVGAQMIPVAVQLREFVLNPNNNLDGRSQEIIFAAMRILNQHYYKSIADQYDFILSDRGQLCHMAYTDHNVSKEFTDLFYNGIVNQITSSPDVFVYFDVDPDLALNRRVKRGEGLDAIEVKGVEFQKKVRESYHNYLDEIYSDSEGQTKKDRPLLLWVDANKTIPEVNERLDHVTRTLVELLNQEKSNKELLNEG